MYYFKTLTSTNNVASELLRKKELPEGSVIYTDFQTAGKGQPGKKWESEAGKNLLFSVILYPLSVSPMEQFLLSMTISLGLCDFIKKYCEGSKIKWPNDIYIKNDKIAGILIENTIIDDRIDSSVAGIGLNINQMKFPPGIPNPVSLKLLTGREFDTGKCLKELLSDLDNRYKQLLYGDRNDLHGEYLNNLYRFNEYQVLRTEKGNFTGRIIDISLSGLLRVEEENGKLREFAFREIEFSDTPY
jgi:BirA family biotin operon repressor/biotin-[acetyl-CoA-carboxylase] ligase